MVSVDSVSQCATLRSQDIVCSHAKSDAVDVSVSLSQPDRYADRHPVALTNADQVTNCNCEPDTDKVPNANANSDCNAN